MMIGFAYTAMKGEPYGRTFTVRQAHLTLADPNRTAPLAQGNQIMAAEKSGAYYLPTKNVISLRVQKQFVIKNAQRLHLMVNIFNLAGARTVTDVNQATGPTFGQAEAWLGGTVVRFSTRYTF